MILSILIPTTDDRERYFSEVMTELCRQVKLLSDWYKKDYWQYVEILKDNSPIGVSIGTKRNNLLKAASGEWSAFVDSDDMVSADYLKILLCNIDTIRSYVNCFSLKGIMTTDGNSPEIFEHSVKYNEWQTNENAQNGQVKYERYINHLNCIRTRIARQFQYPEINMGEDHQYSKLLQQSGTLTNEGYIEEVLYYYKYRSRNEK